MSKRDPGAARLFRFSPTKARGKIHVDRTALLKYWSARAFAVDRGKLICLDTLIRSRTRKIITNINTNLSETITILRLFGAYGAMLICNLNYFN